ncbi:Phage-related protein [Dorea longicatena]|uniref:Phage-related protein n=1 Tax=Dorea longicatena TaxID=88431 RepID=A0A173S7X9_9FIRM|nr:transglycosylase SLT domain-containing protein [Dorea longicatena]CUM85849.1 Phage-related protein [Dorea longicatena]
MPDEIDRLEIAIETESNRANRSLSGMERRLNRIADSLEKVVALASGIGEIGEFDLSGFDKFTSAIDNAIKKKNDLDKKEIKVRTNRSDLKYTEKSLDSIYKKYSNAGLNLDVSGMDVSELEKGLKSSEATAARLKDRLNKKIAIEGTDHLGKTFESIIYDIQKATNEANVYKKAIDGLSVEQPSFTIERDGNVVSELNQEKLSIESLGENAEKVSDSIEDVSNEISNIDKGGNISKISSKFDYLKNKVGEIKSGLTKGGFGNYTKNFMEMLKLPETGTSTQGGKFNNIPPMKENGDYDTEAIQEYVDSFGKANAAANNFSDQIKALKKELEGLKGQGLGEGDEEYDAVAQKLAVVTERQKEYNRSMKEKAKSIIAKEEISKLQIAGTALKALIKNAGKLGLSFAKLSIRGLSKLPQIAKASANAFKVLGSVISKAKDKLGLLQKDSNKGMSWKKMIGSSILFSTVFGAISQIKEAIKAGSDNLVQYSSAYNKSISGMVTSLLYLKNAWAAAFAPIVNVVAPYISKFLDMLAGALNAVGQFMGSLTGKSKVVQAKKAWFDYGKSLESTGNSASKTGDKLKKAKKDAKDLTNYTLGIDELHVIQPSSDSTNQDSGSDKYTGPSPSEMFETSSIDKNVSDFAKKVKDAWKKADFTEIGSIVGTKLKNSLDGIDWNPIQETAKKIGKSFGTFINGFVEVDGLGESIGNTIGEAFNTGLDLANSFLDSTKWDEVGKFIGDGANGAVNTVDWPGIGHFIAQKWNAIFATIGEAARTFDWSNFGKSLSDSLNQFISDFNWSENGARLGDLVKGVLDTLIQFLENTNWQELGNGIADFIGSIDWSGILTRLAEGIGAALGGLAALLWGLIEDAWKTAVNWWKDTAFEDGHFTIEGLFKGIADALSNIGTWIIDHIFTPFITGFKEAFGIHSPSTIMEEQGGYIMAGLYNGVVAKLAKVLEFFGELKDQIVDKFSDVGEWFGDKFGAARKAVTDKFSDIGTWFGRRKADIQNAQSSVSTWFSTKYQSARGYVNSAFSNVGKWFGGRKSDIQNNMKSVSGWFKSTFQTAYKGVTDSFGKIGNFFKGIGKEIKKPIIGAMKAILNGVNWVYEKLGGGKNHFNVAQLDKYANGTNGVSHDTVGIVNDQAGSTYREMVQFPNGKTIIPKGRNVMLPMPKGTKVLPADQTASLMNMPHFKKGIGDFFGGAWAKFKDFTGNIADYISDPKKLVQMAIDKFTDFSSYLEPGLSMAKNAVRGTVGIATKFIKDKLKGFGGSGVNYKPSAGVEQWRATAKKALELTNQFTEANLNRLLMQMKSESGGNPNAINNWDINAKMGIPSKGLMQVIDPTFRAYAMKGFDKNIYDPMSNILAAIRYTLARYGSLERGWKGHGYANGGFPKVGEMFYARESGPELVGKIGNRSAVVNNQQIVDSVSNGVSRANDETNSLLRTIIEYQELLLKKETSVNMDGKRMDKQISKARRNTGFSFSPT